MTGKSSSKGLSSHIIMRGIVKIEFEYHTIYQNHKHYYAALLGAIMYDEIVFERI